MKKEKSHSVFGAYMGAVDEVHKKTKPKKNVIDIDFMDSIAGMMQSSPSFLHENNTTDDTAHGTTHDTAHGTTHDTAHEIPIKSTIQKKLQHTVQHTTQHTVQHTI